VLLRIHSIQHCEIGLADKIEKAGVRQKRKPVSQLGEDQERISYLRCCQQSLTHLDRVTTGARWT
jgi:hypothetical protein